MSGPGLEGGKALAVLFFGVVIGIRAMASWKLSSRPPGPGSGRAPWGLMYGVPDSLGGWRSSFCPQLSKVQEASVDCIVSDPFVAW